MKSGLAILAIAFLFPFCRERYEVPYAAPAAGLLVIEGFINPSGMTKIQLSRVSLPGKADIPSEMEATVRVEGEDNSIYVLNESDSGEYRAALSLDYNTRYRLYVKTSDNREYVSDFREPIKTPAIDSITWIRHRGGVEIFVNARGGENGNRFYKWDYEETWEFNSTYKSYVQMIVEPRGTGNPFIFLQRWGPNNPYNDSMYTCWGHRRSSSVLLGSTSKLAEDVVYQPLIFHPENSIELNLLYSVKISQHKISREAHEFFQKIRKNTESLGSVFDAQPSEIKGNIRCITDESEEVVGFVEVSSPEEKRIFISVKELPEWKYLLSCESIRFEANENNVLFYLYYEGLLPIDMFNNNGVPYIAAANRECVDCRFLGEHKRPDFWP